MDPSITLTAVEANLKRLLLDVASFIENHPASTEPTPLVLRFSGGWVRDKLLKKESKDIDVTIDKMTGYQFGLKMQEYLNVPGNATKYEHGGPANKTKVSKIEANPDKSKHLETATTKIFGLEIDLVNLRKETYTEDSRNPQVEFGTPEEDAMRRDATINAMFYNLNTSSVEDLTGKGLDDLKNGLIRTPLEPVETFTDDPLRVLRLVRFASRFGYDIDDDAQRAMKREEIKKAFMAKITRERVWQEVEKMFKGRDPKNALEYIDSLGLYQVVFVDPLEPDFYAPDLSRWPTTYNVLSRIMGQDGPLRSILLAQREDDYLSWLIGALVPLADAPHKRPAKPGRPPTPYATSVVREGLKASNKAADLINHSVLNYSSIVETVQDQGNDRGKLGMTIRGWGSTWRQQVLFAMLHEIFLGGRSEDATVQRYSAFVTKIDKLNLLEVYNLKPLIDGTALKKALDAPPGPWMKSALDVVIEWQLRNPEISDPTAVIADLHSWKQNHPDQFAVKKPQADTRKRKQGELSSALISHFLRLTIRLIFSQTRNPEVTDAGRRNINAAVSGSSKPGMFDETEIPWKSSQAWALDLLSWTCKSLDTECVEREWGFLVPPVLSVLDDIDIKMKVKGCGLLRLVLLQTPTSLLHRTGLIPVFLESLLSCTTYLPTLTPSKDSAMLINAATPALLSLADAAYPISSSSVPLPQRTELLLTILRKSFFAPFNHAREYIPVARALLAQLPPTLDALGVDTVVHLKDLVPLLGGVLDDPFGPAHPPLLLEAVWALGAVLRNAWPRVWVWRADVLKGLVGLWIRLAEEDGDDPVVARVKSECQEVVGMLDSIMQTCDEEVDWDEEVAQIKAVDERLEELFLLADETA